MFKEIVSIISRIVSYKILLGYTGMIAAIIFWPFPPLNDYLLLNNITDKKALIFTLLTTTIGFSGFILTVLIVSFNIYVKTIKRSTLEFITDNKWLRVIYSSIIGNSIFLLVGYVAVNSTLVAYNLTFIYLGLTLTLMLMLGLFPIAIISLNDTISLNNTKKLLYKIQRVQIGQLYGRAGDKMGITEIEKNPILILKDMAIAGVNDRDWVIPQTIIKGLYELLIESLDAESDYIDENIHAWSLISNHLKRDVIKQHDSVTGKVLLEYNLRAHIHLVDKKLYKAKFIQLDNFILDFVALILETNCFVEIHPYLPKNLISIINYHIDNIEYTDMEIPTPAYHFRNGGHITSDLSPLRMYWHYVNTSLPDLIFKTLRKSIDLNKKSVYDHYTWHISSLLLSVLGDKNGLTEHQKEDLFDHLLYQAESLGIYAISKGEYEGIEPLSEIGILETFRKNKHLGYRAFFSFVHIIKGLSKRNALSGRYIDELFSVARAVAHDQFDAEILNNVVESVIENTIKLIHSEHIDKETVNNLKYQLNAFKTNYLLEFSTLELSKSKYIDKIEEELKNYNPSSNTYFNFSV